MMRNVEATRYSEVKRRANRLGGVERAMGLTALGLVLNGCLNISVDQDALDSLRQVLLDSGLDKRLSSEGGKLKSEDFDFEGEIKNLDLSKFVFRDAEGGIVVPESWEKRYEGGRTKVKAIFGDDTYLSVGDEVRLDLLRDKAIEYTDGKFSKGKSFGSGGGDNRAPIFSSPEDEDLDYNVATDSVFLGNILASDPDGDRLSYGLAGEDKALFRIVNNNGRVSLSFVNTPDPYNPQDSDKDNEYEVEVLVFDSRGAQVKKSFEVEVSHEGGSRPYVWVIKDDDTATGKLEFYGEDSANYILEGQHAGLFHIVDGALKFRASKTYNDGGNNSYNVTVVKSAGVKSHFRVDVADSDVANNVPIFHYPAADEEWDYNVANSFGALSDFSAKDADGDDLSYSLTGDDKALFTLMEFGDKVWVVFKKEPDPYNPLDRNKDSVYDVGVEVSDGKDKVVKSIKVDAYHEGVGLPYVWVLKEGETRTDKLKFYGEDATSYTLKGEDAGLFHIVDGALKFRDGRAYSDNGDNTYKVTVVKSERVESHFTVRVVDDEAGDTNRAPVFDYKNSDKYSTRLFLYNRAEDGDSYFSFKSKDADGDKVKYILKGIDASYFNVDDQGQVRFNNVKPAVDGGSWGAGSYLFKVLAFDGKGGVTEGLGIVQVNDIPSDSSFVDEVEKLGFVGSSVDSTDWA